MSIVIWNLILMNSTITCNYIEKLHNQPEHFYTQHFEEKILLHNIYPLIQCMSTTFAYRSIFQIKE